MQERLVPFISIRKGVYTVMVLLAVSLAGLVGIASPALAKEPAGGFAVFKQCPRFTPELFACVYSQFTGETTLGKLTIPIANPITFQFGDMYDEATEQTGEQPVVAALGETLTAVPQPIPSGLSSLIDCAKIEGGDFFARGERRLCEGLLRNPWTNRASATMELTEPPSQIYLNPENEGTESGVAIRYAVKFHLENPLLGRACYIGSNSDPIVFNFTTGETDPPPPNKPIHGTFGKIATSEEEHILDDLDKVRVDNAFSVPAATGCGWFPGFHGPHGESLLDSVINRTVGLPSPAGYNTAIQTGNAEETLPAAVIASEQ